MRIIWRNEKVSREGVGMERAYGSSEGTIHVFGTVDSPARPGRHRQANGMHGPLFLKQFKNRRIKIKTPDRI